jgi:hypothetical protein
VRKFTLIYMEWNLRRGLRRGLRKRPPIIASRVRQAHTPVSQASSGPTCLELACFARGAPLSRDHPLHPCGKAPAAKNCRFEAKFNDALSRGIFSTVRSFIVCSINCFTI